MFCVIRFLILIAETLEVLEMCKNSRTSHTFFKEYIHVRIWSKFNHSFYHIKHPNLNLVHSNNDLNITRNSLSYCFQNFSNVLANNKTLHFKYKS